MRAAPGSHCGSVTLRGATPIAPGSMRITVSGVSGATRDPALERVQEQAAPGPADLVLLAGTDRCGHPVDEAVVAQVDESDDDGRAGEHVTDPVDEPLAQFGRLPAQVGHLAGPSDVDVELHRGHLGEVADAGHPAVGDVPDFPVGVAAGGRCAG